MSKLKITKSDKLRIILTDVLPYEVPLIFSNEGFYDFLKVKEIKSPPALTKLLYENKNYTIPYNYKIKKSANKSRTLSLIHPACQYKFVDFYTQYESLILNQCSKSKFSLRFPSAVASHYYEKDLLKQNEDDTKTPHVESEVNGFSEQSKYASSYFVYKKYNFLYKFYDSYEFHRLEKKFNYLLCIDISKCFHSIYTHSIAWAVKDKFFAKENSQKKSFESLFDKLMQHSNFNETNGIVIGAEVSRIFAEIILQKVDDQVFKKLDRDGYKLNSDYCVRRYVDDYFIFANTKELALKIQDYLAHDLEYFKLYINDSKTELMEVPYISDLSIAKNEIGELLFEIFSSFNSSVSKNTYEEEEDDVEDVFSIKMISRPSSISNRVIKKIKCSIKTNDVLYGSISGYILSIFKKKIRAAVSEYLKFSDKNEQTEQIIFNFIYLSLDVSYFIYSMDCRVRTSYLMRQIIVFINELKEVISANFMEVIEKKIFDESLLVIRKTSNSKYKTVEIINLLISINTLSKDYRIPYKDLLSIFPNLDEYEDWDYFYYTSLIYYIGNDEVYKDIKKKIELNLVSTFKSIDKPFLYAQYTCLYFDIMSCPSIRKNIKTELTRVVLEKCSLSANTDSINRHMGYITPRTWFINWDANISLAMILMKKELRSAYE